MIHITIQTRTVEAAVRLAANLMETHLLLSPTIDTDHEELKWESGKLLRESNCSCRERPKRCATAKWSMQHATCWDPTS